MFHGFEMSQIIFDLRRPSRVKYIVEKKLYVVVDIVRF